MGKNIGPWTNGVDTVREEHASMRLTIQDAPDQAPQFSKQEFLLTVEEGTGRNRLTTQTGEGKKFQIRVSLNNCFKNLKFNHMTKIRFLNGIQNT